MGSFVSSSGYSNISVEFRTDCWVADQIENKKL